MITVGAFKTKVEGKLHGTSLAKVNDVYGKFFEAAANLRLRATPPSLIRSAVIANAIYDRVYNYVCQDDLDQESVLDIRPVGERDVNDDNVATQGQKRFDIKKSNNTFTVEYVNGVKTLRLSKCLTPRTILATCDTLTGITSSGDVTGLVLDDLNKVSGNSALSFNLSGVTGQGIITFAIDPTDLSSLLNLGAFFEWFKFPLASALVNVDLRWGTSATDYWHKQVTSAQDRAFADSAWQLLNHQWSSATKVGNPNAAAITRLDVVINYTMGTARNAVGLDNITAALGEVWEVLYYSNRFFTDSTGVTWKETPTADTDLIRLDSDGINLLLYEYLLTLQQEIKGKNMVADYAYFRTLLYGQFGTRGVQLMKGLYELFNDKYPSQVIPRQDTYYGFDPLDGYGNSGDGFEADD